MAIWVPTAEDEEKYEDCDRCGERYHGEFISAYLRTVRRLGGYSRVCCPDQEVKKGIGIKDIK
tara:strand:- start:272 stop:460 length:189 start_codon:yes stop_codon:yes gene_type:complete